MDLIIKKLAHMVAYGVLAGLALWALKGGGQATTTGHLLLAFAIAGLYAISDEVHQYFVPGRNPRSLDVGFDLLAAFLVLLVTGSVLRAREVLPRR